MHLIDLVKETFHSIILHHNMELVELNKNEVKIINKHCQIFISCHMGEIYVYLKEVDNKLKIQPLLWAYVFNILDYKRISKQIYPEDFKLKKIVKYDLFLQAQYIRLFCEDILLGNHKKIIFYYENSNNVLSDLNLFFENQ